MQRSSLRRTQSSEPIFFITSEAFKFDKFIFYIVYNIYKLNEKDKVLAHTLNGSALALPRIVASIIENNQTENGITIPKVLHKYTGFKTINWSSIIFINFEFN